MPEYTAVDVFHHPDGVMVPGDTAELPEEVAARGLGAGSLVVAQAVPVIEEPINEPVQTEPPEGSDQSPEE